MPIYIYRCENCGVQFERHQKFSDPPLTRCPECGLDFSHQCPTCHARVSANQDRCEACGQPLCPECGAAVAEEDQVCAACGVELILFCPACNAVVSASDLFCPGKNTSR